jgi:hypothetical protein
MVFRKMIILFGHSCILFSYRIQRGIRHHVQGANKRSALRCDDQPYQRYVSVIAYIPANWAILILLAQIPPKKIQYSILIFLAGVGVHVEVASAGNNP